MSDSHIYDAPLPGSTIPTELYPNLTTIDDTNQTKTSTENLVDDTDVTTDKTLSIEQPEELKDPKEKLARKKKKIDIIRICLVIYNTIFLLLGLIVLALGIFALVTENDIQFPSISSFLSGSIIIIIVSIIVLCISLYGIFVSLLPNVYLLYLYTGLNGVLLVIEIAIGVWAFVNRDNLKLAIREEFQFGIREEYGNGNSIYVTSIDAIQDSFNCCGYYGYGDWNISNLQSNLNRTGSILMPFLYPQSCCDPPNIMNGLYCSGDFIKSQSVPGCQIKVNRFSQGSIILVGVLGVILAFIQTIGILMALFLSCYRWKYSHIKLRMIPDMKKGDN